MADESDLGALHFTIVGDLSGITQAKEQLAQLAQEASKPIEILTTAAGAAAANMVGPPTPQQQRSAHEMMGVAAEPGPQATRGSLAAQIAAVQQQRISQMQAAAEPFVPVASEPSRELEQWEVRQAQIAARSAAIREQTVTTMLSTPEIDREMEARQRDMTATLRRAREESDFRQAQQDSENDRWTREQAQQAEYDAAFGGVPRMSDAAIKQMMAETPYSENEVSPAMLLGEENVASRIGEGWKSATRHGAMGFMGSAFKLFIYSDLAKIGLGGLMAAGELYDMNQTTTLSGLLTAQKNYEQTLQRMPFGTGEIISGGREGMGWLSHAIGWKWGENHWSDSQVNTDIIYQQRHFKINAVTESLMIGGAKMQSALDKMQTTHIAMTHGETSMDALLAQRRLLADSYAAQRLQVDQQVSKAAEVGVSEGNVRLLLDASRHRLAKAYDAQSAALNMKFWTSRATLHAQQTDLIDTYKLEAHGHWGGMSEKILQNKIAVDRSLMHNMKVSDAARTKAGEDMAQSQIHLLSLHHRAQMSLTMEAARAAMSGDFGLAGQAAREKIAYQEKLAQLDANPNFTAAERATMAGYYHTEFLNQQKANHESKQERSDRILGENVMSKYADSGKFSDQKTALYARYLMTTLLEKDEFKAGKLTAHEYKEEKNTAKNQYTGSLHRLKLHHQLSQASLQEQIKEAQINASTTTSRESKQRQIAKDREHYMMQQASIEFKAHQISHSHLLELDKLAKIRYTGEMNQLERGGRAVVMDPGAVMGEKAAKQGNEQIAQILKEIHNFLQLHSKGVQMLFSVGG